MKIFYELKILPKNCSECPLGFYLTNDDGEFLYCTPLSNELEEDIDGNFLERNENRPLKTIE